MCKNYPQNLAGFASIWFASPELQQERLLVAEFFRFYKLPVEVAAHFTNAGFDTLDTLCVLNIESLEEIEKFNKTNWLPGHKVRINKLFNDIAMNVRRFRKEKEKLLHIARMTNGQCEHPTVVTRTNIPKISSQFTYK